MIPYFTGCVATLTPPQYEGVKYRYYPIFFQAELSFSALFEWLEQKLYFCKKNQFLLYFIFYAPFPALCVFCIRTQTHRLHTESNPE